MSQLDRLLANSQLWRSGCRNQVISEQSLSTGHRRLDQALHSGGWPLAGSTELLCDQNGIGELNLLMPALAKLSQQQHIVWLNPPFQPYAPALYQAGINLEHCLFVHCKGTRDSLWAAEELLRAAAFAAVLHWSENRVLADRDVRRLQLAAREQPCWHIHFRAAAMARQSSPAPLRIYLTNRDSQLQIKVLKQAGGPAGQHLLIPRDTQLLHEQKPARYWPQSPDQNSKPRLLLTRLPTPAKTPAGPGFGAELH